MKPSAQGRQPVLIANRGEIAIRIAKTCRRLGFPTVAVYSEADRFAEHARFCDRAYLVGSAEPKASYLNVEKLLEVARVSGAKYVHPGYGFLSERPHFVEACIRSGLVFVGPSAENMKVMGDKIQARSTVDGLGIPRVPGSAGAVPSPKKASTSAREVGYPVLLKAAAGGGGKGMRRVDDEAGMGSAFESASREALGAFGDGALYVEKLIVEPHHVEVQIFGDGKGGAIHLGDRECSIQRRHQKVWEESPSPLLERFPNTREAMFAAAIRIASHIRYAGAGTLEFIVDGKGNFFFLEMNTRLQVEHPVTEWVTGVDLVEWQLLLAARELRLPAIPPRRGHSIEVRLYAEDPSTFLPAPGPIGTIQLPTGPWVRTDSAFHGPGEVSVHYDPMIAKVAVWAEDRAAAAGRLRVALDETRVEPPTRPDGVKQGSLRTNLSFLRRLARHPEVMGGDTTTDLIARNPQLTCDEARPVSQEAAIATALLQLLGVGEEQSCPAADSVRSEWSLMARREGVRG